MTTQNEIIEKIQKMLAKANNNPSQEEAQTAMLMAQRLMAKHNIEMEMVQDKKPDKKEVIQDWSVTEGALTGWRRQLARIICRNFRTDFLINSSQNGFVFIGLKDDVHITVSVFNYCCDILDKGMHKLRRDYRKAGRSTEGVSGDYADGFLKGLDEKFAEQVSKEGWGLILVKDTDVTTEREKLAGKPASKGTHLNRRGDAEAYRKGHQAGKSFGGHQTQIGGK